MRLKKLFLVLIFITSFMLVCALLQPNIVIDKDEIDLNSNDFPSVNAYNCFGSLSKYINVENITAVFKYATVCFSFCCSYC